MPAEPAASVAVVGGGVSGLVAARELALAGCTVTLFESGDRLGGRIRSAEACGVAFDIGAESFATRGGAVRDLIAELGMDAEITAPSDAGAWVVTTERAAPLPRAGTLGIPAEPLGRSTFRALGVLGALRAAVEPLLPRSVGAGAAGPARADVQAASSLAGVVRARLGRRVLDRLVRPVALGVHSADPERIAFDALPGLASAFARTGSLIAAARELRGSARAAGGAVAGLSGGMTSLIDALATDLGDRGARVEFGARVQRVRSAPGGGTEILVVENGAERAQAFDGAVLAVPEAAVRRLIAGEDPAPGADADAGVDADVDVDAGHLVEIVALVLDDERLDGAPRGTGALIPEPDGPIAAKALTHVTAKWSARARDFGPGRHLLRLSYGRAGAPPETLELDDAAVRRLAVADASRILGVGLAETSLRGMVRRTWEMGGEPVGRRRRRPTPIPHPGVGPTAQTGPGAVDLDLPPGVMAAGDWVSGAGIASVVPGARAIALTLLRAVRPDAAGSSDPNAVPGSTHTASSQYEGTARS